MYFLYDNQKEFFCYTLEDTARPENIKVYAETCLPGGLECNVGLFENDHYKKTIIFYTENDKVTIRTGKLSWIGCLAHNGLNYDHTAGCVLVGKEYKPAVFKNKMLKQEPLISVGMKDALRIRIENALKSKYIIKAQFINLDQLS